MSRKINLKEISKINNIDNIPLIGYINSEFSDSFTSITDSYDSSNNDCNMNVGYSSKYVKFNHNQSCVNVLFDNVMYYNVPVVYDYSNFSIIIGDQNNFNNYPFTITNLKDGSIEYNVKDPGDHAVIIYGKIMASNDDDLLIFGNCNTYKQGTINAKSSKTVEFTYDDFGILMSREYIPISIAGYSIECFSGSSKVPCSIIVDSIKLHQLDYYCIEISLTNISNEAVNYHITPSINAVHRSMHNTRLSF